MRDPELLVSARLFKCGGPWLTTLQLPTLISLQPQPTCPDLNCTLQLQLRVHLHICVHQELMMTSLLLRQ